MFFNISNANIYHSACQCIMSDFTAMECFALHRCFSNCSISLIALDVRPNPFIVKMS